MEEGKLLAFDESKGYLSQVEPILRTHFYNILECKASDYAHAAGKSDDFLDQPAYLFRRKVTVRASDFRTQAEVVTWRHLPSKIKSCALVETYIQKYVVPYKNHKLLYRLTYFCNPEKSRKANFVEILESKNDDKSDGMHWDYGDDSLIVKYRSYNGIKEFEITGKKVTTLVNIEFGYRLREIQLDFIKETLTDPKYWLVALHSYKLEDNDILEPVLRVKTFKLIFNRIKLI